MQCCLICCFCFQFVSSELSGRILQQARRQQRELEESTDEALSPPKKIPQPLAGHSSAGANNVGSDDEDASSDEDMDGDYYDDVVCSDYTRILHRFSLRSYTF